MTKNQWKLKSTEILQGKWKTAFLCFTIVCLVQILGAWISTGANTLLPMPKQESLATVNQNYVFSLWASLAGSWAISLPVNLCRSLLFTGIFGMFYAWANGEPAAVRDMFRYFRYNPLIQTFFAVGTVTIINTSGQFVQEFLRAAGFSPALRGLLALLLFAITVVLDIGMFFFQYSLIRNPEMTFRERAESLIALVQPNVWRFIGFELQFLGWWIILGLLGILLMMLFFQVGVPFVFFKNIVIPFYCGVGFYFWPYYHMSKVLFAGHLYWEVYRPKKKKKK